jgi:hypothetical protein
MIQQGDLYLADCCVSTVSSHGTLNDPTVALKDMLEYHVFPEIARLVGPGGGEYEGFIRIIQSDNAGPHGKAEFIRFVMEYCESKGWHWEPQALLMPHANLMCLICWSFQTSCCDGTVLVDLHNHGVTCLHSLKEDEIWEAANDVWHGQPSSKIASGFGQAHRIAQKTIEAKGGSGFLGNTAGSTIHCSVRNDFNETSKGSGVA